MSNLYFFFLAEDGIRDYKVTGVQTCALPISRHPENGALDDRYFRCADSFRSRRRTRTGARSRHRIHAREDLSRGTLRSEERRVGKEAIMRSAREECRKDTEGGVEVGAQIRDM